MNRPSGEGGGERGAVHTRDGDAAAAATDVPGRRNGTAGHPPVKQRHVFYLSGFDPKGPAHYHRLYADEAAKAAALGGYTVQVGKRRKLSEHAAGWSVEYRGPGTADSGPVHTEFEFLRWDDIVR